MLMTCGVVWSLTFLEAPSPQANPTEVDEVEERTAFLLPCHRRLGQIVHLLHHDQVLQACRDVRELGSQGLEDLSELRLDRWREVRKCSRSVACHESGSEAVPEALEPGGHGRRRLDQDHCRGSKLSALPIAHGGGGEVQSRSCIRKCLGPQARAGEGREPITGPVPPEASRAASSAL